MTLPRATPTFETHPQLRLVVDPPLERTPILSLRKWEIVAMLARGREYKEIGAQLGISWRTVADHVREIAEHLPTHMGDPRSRVLLYAREMLAMRIRLDAEREDRTP